LPQDGVLILDKPAGITSRRAAERVRAIAGGAKAGHAGTLDPLATGVLVVCLDRATLLTSYLGGGTKRYHVDALLGTSTDTYDVDGNVVSRRDASRFTAEAVEGALSDFAGEIEQVPPPFSAVKHQGRPLYRYAREGAHIPNITRTVTIEELTLEGLAPGEAGPVARLVVACGPGTYVRSIVHDLGEKLGCGAYMKELIRQRVGPFDLEDAISLAKLAEACRYGFWERYIYSPDVVLLQQPAAVLNSDKEDSVRKGQKLVLVTRMPFTGGDFLRAYSPDGRFIGLIKYDAALGVWRPEKVFK